MEALVLLADIANNTSAEASTELTGLSGALILMGIGMVTVFLVLFLVIWIGNGLIWLVNKYCPEEEKVQSQPTKQPVAVDNLTSQVIAQAVAQITGGKGKVESIKKL